MIVLWWALVELDFEHLLVLSVKVTKLLAFRNYSLLDLTQWQLKVALMPL